MVNKKQLEKGIKVELLDKHTTSKKQAEKIAIEHLNRNPNYYRDVKIKKGYIHKMISVRKELSKSQLKKLKEHSKHHDKSHMKIMKDEMLKDESFRKAHLIATKFD